MWTPRTPAGRGHDEDPPVGGALGFASDGFVAYGTFGLEDPTPEHRILPSFHTSRSVSFAKMYPNLKYLDISFGTRHGRLPCAVHLPCCPALQNWSSLLASRFATSTSPGTCSGQCTVGDHQN